jgi:hypothetical protein
MCPAVLIGLDPQTPPPPRHPPHLGSYSIYEVAIGQQR